MSFAGEHRRPLRLMSGLLGGHELVILPEGGILFRGEDDWRVTRSWCTSWLAVLRLARTGTALSVPLWRHRQPAGGFRRLAVRCRHGAHALA